MPVSARDPSRRIADNPFYILALPPDCSRLEIEREGQKWLGMLEVGLSAARHYWTPLGAMERTTHKVREAMAELRDPERRLRHELWARLAPEHVGDAPGVEPTGKDAPGFADARARRFVNARARLGWSRS